MKKILCLLLILCCNISLVDSSYATRRTAYFVPNKVQGIDKSGINIYKIKNPKTKHKFMASFSIINGTNKPIDFTSASYYGVDRFSNKEFKLQFVSIEKSTGAKNDFILQPKRGIWIDCFFPDSGESTKEIYIKLANGKKLSFHRSGYIVSCPHID